MRLDSCRIGLLTTDGFDAPALSGLEDEFRAEGAEVRVIGIKSGPIRGWADGNWADFRHADMVLDEVSLTDFDGIVLVPGLLAVDVLRTERFVINFVSRFAARGRVIAAIGHAPLILMEAGLARGKRVTGARSIRTDLRNAGGLVREAGTVGDGKLVTAEDACGLANFVAAVSDSLSSEAKPEAA